MVEEGPESSLMDFDQEIIHEPEYVWTLKEVPIPNKKCFLVALESVLQNCKFVEYSKADWYKFVVDKANWDTIAAKLNALKKRMTESWIHDQDHKEIFQTQAVVVNPKSYHWLFNFKETCKYNEEFFTMKEDWWSDDFVKGTQTQIKEAILAGWKRINPDVPFVGQKVHVKDFLPDVWWDCMDQYSADNIPFETFTKDEKWEKYKETMKKTPLNMKEAIESIQKAQKLKSKNTKIK